MTLLLLFYYPVAGQRFPVAGQRVQKAKVYDAIVSTVFQGKNYKGPLLDVNDSSVTILSKGTPVPIPVNSIRALKFRRKAAVGRGALVGGITGLGLGAIIGSASGDDECPQGSICLYEANAGETALAGGLVFSGVGTVVGVLIGSLSSKEKITINGKREILQANQQKIKEYLFER